MRTPTVSLFGFLLILGFSAFGQDSDALKTRIREIQTELRHIDSLIADQKAQASSLRQKQAGLRSSAQDSQQRRAAKIQENSQRIRDLKVRITELNIKSKMLSSKRDKILADSGAGERQVGKRGDSLTLAIGDLSVRLGQESIALAKLQDERKMLSEAKNEQEAVRRAAVEAGRARVASFDGPVALGKETVQTAKNGLDKAKADSVSLQGLIAKGQAVLRDNLAALDKSIAFQNRRSDSLVTAQNKVRSDSVAAWKKNDDSLTTLGRRLVELRRSLADKDTAILRATESLNQARKDSLESISKYVQTNQQRQRDIVWLDSLIPALQNHKALLMRMSEKLQLDSIVAELTERLTTFLRKSYDERMASTGAEAEMSQMLDNYKGKRDILERDPGIESLTANAGDLSRGALAAQVLVKLDATRIRLDSAVAASDKASRDNVVQGKQSETSTRDFSSRIQSFSAATSKMSREVINARPGLQKLGQDSAAALTRRDETSVKFGRLIEALIEAQGVSRTQAASFKTQRDSLATRISEQEAVNRTELGRAHDAIAREQGTVRRALASLDSVVNLRQRARGDSTSAVGEKTTLVAKAAKALDANQEQVTLKKSQVEMLKTQLSKARTDSASVVLDRAQQREIARKTLAEQARMAGQANDAAGKLRDELAAARIDSAGLAVAGPGEAQKLSDELAANESRVADSDRELLRLQGERDRLQKERVDKELALERAVLAAGKKPVPEGTPTPAASSPAASPQPTPEDAQTRLARIYQLVELGKADAARGAFAASRGFLEANLDPEALAAIRMTLESLPSEGPVAGQVNTSKKDESARSDEVKKAEAVEKAAKAAEAKQAREAGKARKAEEAKQAKDAAKAEKAGIAEEEKRAREAEKTGQAKKTEDASPPPVVATPTPEPSPPPPPETDPNLPRESATVFITTVPPVASVYMDGEQIGKSNVGNLKVTSGKHMMQFVKGDLTCTKEMSFIPGANAARVVKLPCTQ